MRRFLAHFLALLLTTVSIADANDVVVSIKGGTLSIKGDADGNRLRIDGTGLPDDTVRITPDGGTTVNGLAGAQTFSGFVGGVTIKLGDGNDDLEVFQKTLAGKVAISLGNGADRLRIDDATIGGPTKIDMGAGDDAFAACDGLFQSDVSVKLGKGTGGSVSTTCGAGSASTSNASVMISLNTLFQAGLALKAAPAVHVVVFDDTAIQGKLSSKNVALLALCYGAFADVNAKMPKILGNFGGEVTCDGGVNEGFANGNTAMVVVDSPVGALKWKGNAGGDTLVAIGTPLAGAATVDLGAGFNFVAFDAVTMPSLVAKAGRNDDDFFLEQSVVAGDVTVKYGGGANVIDFTDSAIGGNLLVKTGAGNDVVTSSTTVVSGTRTIDAGKGANTVN